jgi:hypothetical protein
MKHRRPTLPRLEAGRRFRNREEAHGYCRHLPRRSNPKSSTRPPCCLGAHRPDFMRRRPNLWAWKVVGARSGDLVDIARHRANRRRWRSERSIGDPLAVRLRWRHAPIVVTVITTRAPPDRFQAARPFFGPGAADGWADSSSRSRNCFRTHEICRRLNLADSADCGHNRHGGVSASPALGEEGTRWWPGGCESCIT